MRANTLIIGYGNVDRQDDGVGWHVLKYMAEFLDTSLPDDTGAAIDVEHELVDLMYILQIYPELAETISHYQRVCFVDAHTSDIKEEICWTILAPQYEKSPLTHHMSPRTLLSISKTIYGRIPETILVSVRGYSFEFEHELSPKTEKLARKVSQRIFQWVKEKI